MFKTSIENIKPLVNSKINLRIAPSPTGKMHLGNLFVFSWCRIAANINKAQLILRIDDTDCSRNRAEDVDNIYRVLQEYNIKYDVTIIQSERKFIYHEVINMMLKASMLYYCQCENIDRENDPLIRGCQNNCREKNLSSGALRIYINPTWICDQLYDHIRGIIRITDDIHDMILVRQDGECLYHLASCIDDFFCKINIIIRSVEWMQLGFLHLYIFKCMNELFETQYNPTFIHLPLIVDADGKKLSKRKQSINLIDMLNSFLPEAVMNYVLYISRKSSEEIFSINNVKELNIRTSQPIFDIKKLTWFNRKYINQVGNENILLKYIHIEDEDINPFEFIKRNKQSFNLLDDWKKLIINKNDSIEEYVKYCNIDELNKFIEFIENFYEYDFQNEKEANQLFRKNICENNEAIHRFRFLIIKSEKGMPILSLIKSFKKQYLLTCFENAKSRII